MAQWCRAPVKIMHACLLPARLPALPSVATVGWPCRHLPLHTTHYTNTRRWQAYISCSAAAATAHSWLMRSRLPRDLMAPAPVPVLDSEKRAR